MKSFLKGVLLGSGIGLLILGICFGFLYRQGVFSDDGSGVQTTEAPAAAPADPEDDLPIPEEFLTETSADPEAVLSEETNGEDEAPEEPSEDTAAPATLSFAGDVMFSEQYLAAYDRSGIQAFVDAGMLSLMQDSDLFLLNEEFPFSLQGEAMEDKQYTFRTDPKYVQILKDLGTDIVTVANNHALDFGQAAFRDTLETLKNADISFIGGGCNIEEASAPVIRTINGQTFAVFGATRVSPSYDWYATDSQPGLFQTYDPSRLNAGIAEASLTCDHVIVFVHWGIERNEFPEEYQRALARGYIEAGADLIVGCHPHVLQGFEYYQGVPIVYSLGNYLFGNRDGETLLLQAVFHSPEEKPSIQLVPCRRVNGVLTQIQDPSVLYQHLEDLSFDVKVNSDGSLEPGAVQ